MLSGVIRIVSCVCVILAGVMHCAGAEAAAADIAAAARAAKSQFRPLTQSDVQQARQDLAAAAERLEQRFRDGGPNAADWRRFVQFDDMLSQLAPGHTPDRAKLGAIYALYASGNPGLELVAFHDVRVALRQYLAAAQGVQDPQLQAKFNRVLDNLAAQLAAYATSPSSEAALRISNELIWLADARQVTALRDQVAAAFRQPNLVLEVSNHLAAVGVARDVDQIEPVQDCILGTSLYGTARMIGQVTGQLVADEGRGVMDSVLQGTVSSNNIGYHHPVTICSTALTSVTACKRLFITPDGLAALPASSQVTTHSTITGITSNRKMGRRFVEKIAWKKAAAQKGQAEAIASAHAQVRINTRVDQQTEDLLTQSNEQYTDKFWGPLNERGLFPEQLQLSSSGQSMKIVALGAAPLQLAALGEPPRIATPDADLGATVHESMINNMLQIALGGMIVREENVQEIATRLLGHLPEQLKPDKEQEPWAVTFAEQQPISVAFGNNEVRVTVRGHRFARGDNNYPGMNVTARYQLVGTGQQVKAVRQGGLEIFPPDFVPGSGQRLSGRQVAIRKLLQRRFGKIFPEEMVPQGFVPKGNLAKAGKLTPVEIASRDGWLLVALKAVASPPAVTQASDAPPRVAVSGQQ